MIQSFLLLATAASSLASAATVAIFGIYIERVLVTNPLASYPLDQSSYIEIPTFDHFKLTGKPTLLLAVVTMCRSQGGRN